MRSLLPAVAVTAAALVFAATSDAQKPPKARTVTLKGSADTVTFSTPLTLTGSVQGEKAGVAVALERRPSTSPAFVAAGTAVTDVRGDFSFTERPQANTVYRVTAAITPPATSAEVAAAVAPLVGLRVGDSTPRSGRRVSFRGTVRPAHDGRRVAIQRKRADGTWRTVATPPLLDAGSAYSRYSRRVRISRSGTYRTVIAAHADHAQGTSRERTLTVH